MKRIVERVGACAQALLDFVFPKSDAVLELEAMSASEMARILPAAEAMPDQIVAVFAYHHPLVRDLVWELKYRGNRSIARKLALILKDVIQEEVAERALYENFGASGIVLAPMPMSAARRRARGYNQTEILCQEIMEAIREEIMREDDAHLLVYEPALLEKRIHTAPQTELVSREARLHNLTGSMRVSYTGSLKGRSVILVDDVTTTGASFAEARRALKEAGVKKILCLAVAH